MLTAETAPAGHEPLGCRLGALTGRRLHPTECPFRCHSGALLRGRPVLGLLRPDAQAWWRLPGFVIYSGPFGVEGPGFRGFCPGPSWLLCRRWALQLVSPWLAWPLVGAGACDRHGFLDLGVSGLGAGPPFAGVWGCPGGLIDSVCWDVGVSGPGRGRHMQDLARPAGTDQRSFLYVVAGRHRDMPASGVDHGVWLWMTAAGAGGGVAPGPGWATTRTPMATTPTGPPGTPPTRGASSAPGPQAPQQAT